MEKAKSINLLKEKRYEIIAAALGSIKSARKTASSRENGGGSKAEKCKCENCGRTVSVKNAWYNEIDDVWICGKCHAGDFPIHE